MGAEIAAALEPGEKVLNLGQGGGPAFVSRADDPLQSPVPYATPPDFAGQYPTPLDTTEIIAMCEELSAWQAIPEETTALYQHTWRELNALAFTSGSSYISFADGNCPEEYAHDGMPTTVTLKNIGAKKNLSVSEIMHSAAIAAANWNGINRLVGPAPAGEGLPGGSAVGSFQQEYVADLKEKEIRLAMTLVMNGWDRLLIQGDASVNPLEFSGLEALVDPSCCNYASGTSSGSSFTAQTFDRFLAASCAKPTTIFGHPQAIQELMMAYFALGYNGSQLITYNTGDRITPGFNFGGFVNTGIGRLGVVSDRNFDRTPAGGNGFVTDLFGLRMNHNGVPLVFKITQIPLALQDLVPGCTAIAFEVWAKTALVVKHCCAQSRYDGYFTGSIITTCPVIG